MYNYLSDFLVHTLRQNLNVMYAQVHKNGKLIEEYKRMPVKTRLNTWSVSKGIVACAAGIAIEEGLIKLDEKLIDIFPEYKGVSKYDYINDITVYHLLTMTTGLEDAMFFCDGPERYTCQDWVENYFKNGKFVYEPGTHFLYSNHNTFILSAAIEKRAGQNLLEYLRFRLLEPMGMHNPDWTLSPKGHVHAANGLYFTIDEYSAYGEMLLHKGNVNGKQLVPKEFMEKAFSPMVNLKGTQFENSNGSADAYGYYFVITKDQKAIRSDGNYGQVCYVFPEQDMVVTIMSLEGDFGKIYEYAWEDIAKKIIEE